MNSPENEEVAALLRDFEFVDSTWQGIAFAPFWGIELIFSIYPYEDRITARQLNILQSLLNQTNDLRQEFEYALFSHYREDVEGSYSGYDPILHQEVLDYGPPILTDSSEIWKLIDEPVVCIPWLFRTKSSIEFELSFNCEWDPEHGLGVLYRNWHPIKFGSWNL